MISKLYFFSIMLLLLSGCGGSAGSDAGDGSDSEAVTPPVQGSRILGMDVKEIPSVTYAMAYEQAMAIGVREVSVSLNWAQLEPSVGNYDNTLPGVIEIFYPVQPGDLTLVLRPLDTPGPSMPAELAGRDYDDPEVITAFENFLTNLHAQLPALSASGKLKWIHIGNEIDAYLGNNGSRWVQWQTFFQAAKAKVRSLWGTDVEVSSIVQFSMLTDAGKKAYYLDLLPELDNAVLTYYPLNSDFTMRPVSSVATDFALMVDEIPGKNILLQECGYSSSPASNSSETQQADFITAVFEAWDNYNSRIRLVDIAWQYDVASATVDQWVIDYGMLGNPDESEFRAYLGGLGLNNYDSSEKEAMQRLRTELKSRKWIQ